MTRPIRIANMSGFLGDRREAPRQMLDGGPIDVLSGDYLAELTMAILARKRMRDPEAGYADVFLDQLRDVLVDVVDRGVRVVANAGGLAPRRLAAEIERLAAASGVAVTVGVVDGDDLMPRLSEIDDDWPHLVDGRTLAERGLTPLLANAYLGGFGIARALERGADIVVTGRVADASLATGPAIWWHGWTTDDLDALAGAVVAGHVIECGAQATGGNFAFFAEVPGLEEPGFPIAEIEADGGSVITMHPGHGGRVTVETVTAQLLYEIDGARYANPDVVARLDTVRLVEEAQDRVRITGVEGEPAPATTKVGMVCPDGFRNTVTFLVPGLDVEAKADLVLRALWRRVGGVEQFTRVHTELARTDQADPPNNEAACARLRVSVFAGDADLVGRAFSSAAVELALASYPGFTLTEPPRRGVPNVVFWPTVVERRLVPELVTVAGVTEVLEAPIVADPAGRKDIDVEVPQWDGDDDVVVAPLGRVIGARSGDKGGDANLGVWARSDEAAAWLYAWLDEDRLRRLLPETAALDVTRTVLPNLRAINFVIHGLLGEGAAASTRFDPQAKTLGEYFRARHAEIPERLLVG